MSAWGAAGVENRRLCGQRGRGVSFFLFFFFFKDILRFLLSPLASAAHVGYADSKRFQKLFG